MPTKTMVSLMTGLEDTGGPVADAETGGTVLMWEWIGDEAANTFSH